MNSKIISELFSESIELRDNFVSKKIRNAYLGSSEFPISLSTSDAEDWFCLAAFNFANLSFLANAADSSFPTSLEGSDIPNNLPVRFKSRCY